VRRARFLPAHELVGLRVRVLRHTDPTLVGLTGIVEDETKNTLLVSGKVVPKRGAVFEFSVSGRRIVIKGDDILYRPVERTRRVLRRKGRWRGT